MLWLGNFWCFGLAVACGRCRLREVVAHEGSIAYNSVPFHEGVNRKLLRITRLKMHPLKTLKLFIALQCPSFPQARFLVDRFQWKSCPSIVLVTMPTITLYSMTNLRYGILISYSLKALYHAYLASLYFELMKIWKSYMWTAEWRIIWK